jgi:ABC-type phosphate/phosphonate transport system substrate-binding protein
MILDKEKLDELEKASEPLVKFLCENAHPHVVVIVTPDGAELVEGVARVKIDKYIKD